MKALLAFFFLTTGLFAQVSGSGRIGGTGTQLFVTNQQTATYQTLINDFQFCKTITVPSGTFTITLVASTAQPASGRCIQILNYGSGTITIAPSGQLINSLSSNFIIQPGSPSNPTGLWIVSDGTNYEAQGFGTVPASLFSCAILDNSICTSAVDSSGNPNFLTTAAGTSLPINGGTTPLNMFIGGVYQVLNSNVTLTVPSTASVQQWILAKQDTTHGGLLVAADFLAMNTAPFYQYTAPTCPSPSPALSSTNPSFWFDLSTNLSKLCTSNGGSYSAAASMVIGTIFVDATPKVLQVLPEPYRLNAYVRYQNFGTGADGVLTITTGTTTIDTHKQYQSVLMTAGTLTHSSVAGTTGMTVGVSFYSQSPVMLIGTAAVNANAVGTTGVTGTTGAGGTGGGNVRGGGGGGGGGSGTVSAAGGTGGTQLRILSTGTQTGAAGGTAAPTGGSNGAASQSPQPPSSFSNQLCMGASGGGGAGDATNAGGSSGAGGGSIFFRVPSVLAISTASITANGAAGSAGAAGNAAGGGGGGGGCIDINAGFLTVAAATITVAGGNGGAKAGAGSGTTGGSGGTGNLQETKLW